MLPIFLNIKFLAGGLILTIVGALPFGLVNLSVADTAFKHGMKEARRIALGATLIELLFGLTAILSAHGLEFINQNNPVLGYTTIGLLMVIGLYYFLKPRGKETTSNSSKQKGILKGIGLNLISLQVLLYWLFAVVYLTTTSYLPMLTVEILFFILGIVLAKLMVLELYGKAGIKLLNKSTFIEKNINRITGLLLYSAALFQYFKI